MKPWRTGRVYLNFIGDEGPDRVEGGVRCGEVRRLQELKNDVGSEQPVPPNQNIAPSAGASS